MGHIFCELVASWSRLWWCVSCGNWQWWCVSYGNQQWWPLLEWRKETMKIAWLIP